MKIKKKKLKINNCKDDFIYIWEITPNKTKND